MGTAIIIVVHCRRPQLWSALSLLLKLIVVYCSPPLLPRSSKIQQDILRHLLPHFVFVRPPFVLCSFSVRCSSSFVVRLFVCRALSFVVRSVRCLFVVCSLFFCCCSFVCRCSLVVRLSLFIGSFVRSSFVCPFVCSLFVCLYIVSSFVCHRSFVVC